MKGIYENLPLLAGFISQFVVDPLPLQRLCYNDPISRFSTNNDVVRERTVRALKIAYKVNQDLAVVTYYLAIASKVVFPPGNSGREIYVGIPENIFTLARISVVLISIIPTQKCVTAH